MYMLHKYSENCAYAGIERSANIVSSYRDQFSTLIGNPKTFWISAEMPFYIWQGGVGLSFQNSKAGLIDLSHLRVSYNRVFGTPYGFFSLGSRIGLQFLNIDGSKIITPDGSYEATIIHNDPYLDAIPVNGIAPSWELSTYFYNYRWEGGCSVFQFPRHEANVGLGKFRFSPHLSAMATYHWQLTDEWKISPSILIKGQGSIWQTDISSLVHWRDQTFGGVGFRGYNSTSVDALTIIFGSMINGNTKISYSYDFGLSTLGLVHQGSHEFMVSYNFQTAVGIGLPPKIIHNPRHL
jgi:type IX secretion system PorP/SprF family membrane protein